MLLVSFDFDRAGPESDLMEIGFLRVRGDDFVSFEWFVDEEALSSSPHPFVGSILRVLPSTLRAMADNWPAYRNRSVPAWKKENDPRTLADYYCHSLRQSTILISEIRAN